MLSIPCTPTPRTPLAAVPVQDLARLVVKILNLQDALQSAARNMTPHLMHVAASAGGGSAGGRGLMGAQLLPTTTTTLIGMV